MIIRTGGITIDTISGGPQRVLYNDIFPIWNIAASSDDLWCNQRTDYAFNKRLQRKRLVDEIKRRTTGYF